MPVLSKEEFARTTRSNVVSTSNGEPDAPSEWKYERDVFDGFLSEEELSKRANRLIDVSPSQFVEFAIRMPNKKTKKFVPFTFDGRKYLRLPYDTPSKRTLYKCG